MSDTTQVHCPFCNAVVSRTDSGDYECDFCLQPFSVAQAEREEDRLLAEIKGWLQQKVGAAALDGSGVDASSRSYIFQDKILPELKRDVDRSLEIFGSFGQFPLIKPPIPVTAAKARGENPLVQHRGDILSLKGLRARLNSPYVASFAVAESDKSVIQVLDQRIADFIHLSNVAEAASLRTALGYASARRNLEALVGEVQQSLSLPGIEAGQAAFLASVQNRYQGLIEICRICEELASATPVSGADIAERLDGIGGRLTSVARAIEGLDYSPADTMPVVIGVDTEVAHARLLARWSRAYDSIRGHTEVAFMRFVAETIAVLGQDSDAAMLADLLESTSDVLRAVRGEVAVSLVDDFSWVDGWAEQARQKKSFFGLFGTEETVEQLHQFMLPVWVADVTYSKATGGVFKEGQEARCVVAVDACNPDPAGVGFFTDPNAALPTALEHPQPLGDHKVALPMSTTAGAAKIFERALKAKQGLMNPRVAVRGLAYVSAAVVEYESPKGARELARALGGQLRVESSARYQVQAADQVLQRFS